MIKVFLVDDEIVIREAIRNAFPWEDYGYTLVGEAPDGEIALPMIRDANPDILITDIRMPFMDGMALCREMKRQMPWVRIVILSGYDDFSYAREAISLGVQEYMLKPVSVKDLRDVLDRIAVSIKESKLETEIIDRKRRMLASSDQFLKEKLLSSLFYEDMDMRDNRKMIEQMHTLGINLAASCYCVIDMAFTQKDGTHSAGRDAIFALAENNVAVNCCTGRQGARALVMGDSEEDTEERAYAFANSALRELEHVAAENILITIGEIVTSLADIRKSVDSAHHTRQVVIARNRDNMSIVGVRELSDTPVAIQDLNIRPLYEQLQYITVEELPEVFERYVASLGAVDIRAAAAADYVHVEAMMTASRIICEAGGNPETELAGLWKGPSENAEDLSAASALLEQALRYRNSKKPNRGNSSVDKARIFLAQHYSDVNLMLQDVAKAVCMSGSRFSTVFSQETGHTFTEYLTALRIGKAKELLRATDMRSSQIAWEVGYNDPHYFSYLFKKNTGSTPSEYRKAHQGNDTER